MSSSVETRDLHAQKTRFLVKSFTLFLALLLLVGSPLQPLDVGLQLLQHHHYAWVDALRLVLAFARDAEENPMCWNFI